MEDNLGSSPGRQRKGSWQERDGRKQMVLTSENLSESHRGTAVMGRDAITEHTERCLHSTDINLQIKGLSNCREINKMPENILIES